MSRNPKPKDRIAELEREVARLDKLLRGAMNPGVFRQAQNVVWAKTWTSSEGDYPDDGNYLPIVFLQASFNEHSSSSILFTDQHSDSQRVAYFENYLERGTRVQVFRQNKQWWGVNGTAINCATIKEIFGITSNPSENRYPRFTPAGLCETVAGEQCDETAPVAPNTYDTYADLTDPAELTALGKGNFATVTDDPTPSNNKVWAVIGDGMGGLTVG